MKKLVALLLALTMVMAFAACGSTNNEPTPSPQNDTTQSQPDKNDTNASQDSNQDPTEDTEKTEENPAHTHSYTETVTAPTCTTQGYTTHTCAECANSYKDNYTAAKGHNFICSGTVETLIKCDRCSTNIRQGDNIVDFYAISNTAYWKDGQLCVQYMIVNTYDADIILTGVENFYFVNKSGQKICQNLNTTGASIRIKANSGHVVTLTVEKALVQNYGADLTGVGMNCQQLYYYFA